MRSAVSKRALKVCIVGLKCYDHISEKPVPQYLGGIETQLAVLARGLLREGCEVSLVTFDHGQNDEETFGGVKVFKSYSPTGGVRVVRSFARAKLLWKAMQRADADIYLQMGAGSETGLSALGCRFKSPRARRFVFCLASDADCKGAMGTSRFSMENRLYRHGAKKAALIVAQTQNQQRNLKKNFGLDAGIIPMAVPDMFDSSVERRANKVLWVGRLMPEKRFEWLLEAARRCPEMEFHVAGTPNQPSGYAAQVLAEAKTVPNVHAHGRLARADLNKLFQSAGLLCCTSMLEGFPTTFLEAWSSGLPVVTTFDPDGIVAREGLGSVVTTVDELVAQLRSLPNTEACARMARAAREFFLENYSVETIARAFRLAFEGVVAA
ncbi:MAG TPA: glycosyltransferase family 4 protein [Candidatus Polarisedimenticolia bacterium]|nr:glycosyltransferase family 4 protein [Candidatus Polarisedimenticolia bacterium]